MITTDNLLKKFEEIHNFIYANDGLSPQQTLDEFLKILFIKIYDENNNLNQFVVSKEEFSLSSLGKESPLNQRITTLFIKTKKEYSEIFESDDKIKLSSKSIGFVVNKLQGISLGDSSSDAKGLAFQKFLTHQDKEGRGQYFTPEPVIDFCVKMINPKFGETIIDPCCGSGGFIFTAYNHIMTNEPATNKSKLIADYLFGSDISKSIARISKMKFLLEANIQSNIHCQNSLEDLDSLKLTFGHEEQLFDGFDVLLTNPPFGTAGKIMDASLLSKYDLGHKWEGSNGSFVMTKTVCNAQPAEILFIERCLQLLKEGGRMAIVLPNGHFENPSLDYLRAYIKGKANILAVVNLPQETFIPYGTGVKTSLLFLEKESANTKTTYPLFFGKVTKPGYQGNKNGTPVYKKDVNGALVLENGQPVIDEDFSIVLKDYETFQRQGSVKTDNSYSIKYNEINDRFDYDYYSPAYKEMLDQLEKNSVRLGDIVEVIKKKSPKLKDKTAVVEYVELSDVNTHSLEIINSTTCAVHELPSRATYEIATGDIITAIAGNSVGTKKHATAIVNESNNGAICTNGFRVLRNPKVNPYYLLYYFKSDLFLKQMMRYRTGAAIPNVSDSDLMNVLVYIPSEDKMNEIGNSVRRAFELRAESAKILESITLD